MALIEPFMVKSEYNLGAGESFTLSAETGESLLVKDILIAKDSSDYVTISIDRDTVGFFRTSGHTLRSHLRVSNTTSGVGYSGLQSIWSKTLLSLMIRRGYFKGFPVAEGQKLIITPYPESGAIGNIMVVYEKYDACLLYTSPSPRDRG